MKNILILLFLLIFLYIICNRCIEKFSVGGSDINISDNLTLSYVICLKPTDSCLNFTKSANNLDECDKYYMSDFSNTKYYRCKINDEYPGIEYCKMSDEEYKP